MRISHSFQFQDPLKFNSDTVQDFLRSPPQMETIALKSILVHQPISILIVLSVYKMI